MKALPFIRKHRQTYVRFTALGVGVVSLFASIQMLVILQKTELRYFIIPALLGLVVGLLFSTLVAVRKEVQEGRRRLKAMTDMAQEFIYLRRTDGYYEYVSPSCLQLTGYSAEEFHAQPSFMTQLIHPDDRPRWDRHVHQMDSEGKPEKLRLRIVTKSGTERWIEHLCSDVRNEQGEIYGVRSVNLDITERVRHEKELELSAVAFQTHEAIMITDSDARILRVNQAFSEVTGYAAEEVIGRTPDMLKSDRHDDEFFAGMWRSLLAEGRWSGEVWDRRKNGEVYPKFLTITAVPEANKESAYYVASFSDITERKVAEEEINRLAFYDPLTRLPNRRLLAERLDRA